MFIAENEQLIAIIVVLTTGRNILNIDHSEILES